jgi:hypothetical protein
VANKAYGSSLKAAHSTSGPDLLGGSLGFRNTAHRTMVIPMTKPMTLTVHPNPTFGRRDSAIAGYTRPPVAEPDAATPRASERFLRKYVEQIVMEGMKTSPLPRPTQMPCARKTCQYVVQSEVIKIPTSWIIMPMMKVRRKKPASVARPENAPMRKGMKISTLPTHDMVDGGWWRAVV